MQLPDEGVMYKAMLKRDQEFEGIFFTAVKTTGIFCRPTCPARKPKRENVEFFATTKASLDHGYRPCKRCKPMQLPGGMPEWVDRLEKELIAAPNVKIRDRDLRALDLNPATVRRWFKQRHGMTFQAYQRSLRLNQAFGHLRNGKSVTEAAYQSGYESLSGFNEAFQKSHTTVPSLAGTLREPVYIRRIPTPLGPMLGGVRSGKVCLLEFADRRMLETQIENLKKYFKCRVSAGSRPLHDDLEDELLQYFDGNLKKFGVPLDTPGTPFQKKVWKALQRVTYGTTTSYQSLAVSLDNPRAVRAVASANGHNRIAIVVPCHRIIGADGALKGYGGGIWRKQWLLDHERG